MATDQPIPIAGRLGLVVHPDGGVRLYINGNPVIGLTKLEAEALAHDLEERIALEVLAETLRDERSS